MKTLLHICAFALLVAAGCKKDSGEWTPTGSNTFSCKVDGRNYEPKKYDGLFGSPPSPLRSDYNSSKQLLFVETQHEGDEGVSFYIQGIRSGGVFAIGYTPFPYPANPRPSSYGAYWFQPPRTDPYVSNPRIHYRTDSLHTGTVHVVRFDTVARVAGGTFEFTARDAASGKLVRITDGRFDVKF